MYNDNRNANHTTILIITIKITQRLQDAQRVCRGGEGLRHGQGIYIYIYISMYTCTHT